MRGDNGMAENLGAGRPYPCDSSAYLSSGIALPALLSSGIALPYLCDGSAGLGSGLALQKQ